VRLDGAGRLAGGFGLSGMAERARILDARLDVISAPGQGTRLELWVPVTKPAQAPSPAPGEALRR
jgi:signal transduction histidine kinase